MKSIIRSLALVLALSASRSASAAEATSCLIYLNAHCAGSPSLPVNAWFEDRDSVAKINSGRCSQRAREYHDYCAKSTADIWVASAFMVNGIMTTARTQSGKLGSPLDVIFGYGWVALAPTTPR